MISDETLDSEMTRVGGVCLLLTSIVFVVWGGIGGLVASGVLAILLYRFESMYATAFGHFAFVAVSTDYGVVPLTLAEIGLFGILISPVVRYERPVRLLVPLLTAVGVLGGVTYAGLSWYDSTVSAVMLSLATICVTVYGLSLYDRTTLDVTGDGA